jgi:hypothetical protein
MRSRRRNLILSAGFCVWIAACAADPVNQGSYPTAPFQDLADEIAITQHCAASETFGCATITASGSLVRGGFVFKDVFAKCENTASGKVISIKNAEDENFTFNVQINIPTPAVGTATCEAEDDGGCFVSIILHTSPVLSSAAEPCYVTLDTLSPIRGNLVCEGLSTTSAELTLESGSMFACKN